MRTVTTILLIFFIRYIYAASESHVFTNINNFTGDLSDSCIFGVKSVSMVLFTRNIVRGTFVEVNKSCGLFDPSKPVYFMAHGFLAYSRWSNFYKLAALLLKREDCTIFSLDWADASCYNDPAVVRLLEYPFAVFNTRKVGEYLASYVKSIIGTCGVSLKDITLIGHSLGAHISGYAAKNLQESDYGTIPLLIGTDPAAPLFMLHDCEDRFCDTDADRVLALHTSSLGIQYSLAHFDLWFNNGFRQPACGFLSLNVNCSHNIAVKYLANTLLDDCAFTGVPVQRRTFLSVPIRLLSGCSSNKTNCIVVDYRIFDKNDSTKGDYCVEVKSEYPYCAKNDYNCQQ